MAQNENEPAIPEDILSILDDIKIPEEQKVKLTAMLIHQQKISLNVPPPKMLAEYEAVYPGAIEIFFRRVEEEAKHRRSLEKKIVDSGTEDSRLGLKFGFAAVFFCLCLAAYAIYKNAPWVASIISVSSLGALVTAFRAGRNSIKSAEKDD